MRPHDPRQIGPYRLRGRLGAGGMGEVYLAGSPGGRDVVVKIIRPELADTDHARRRFVREIAAAQRVGGFHTAQVVDAAPDADPPWMVTEYIPGPSLQRLVRDSGAFSPEQVRLLAAQLSEGLAAIHACGLVHRDLKPGNVIMASDGARIIDFGIARMDDASVLTETGAVVGTYAFMSPEQVHSGDIGPASDVFSLGAVLTFAATGRSPFAAATIPAIVHRIITAEPNLGMISGGLRGLITACLAKNPADRPAATDLLGWLSGSGGAIHVPPPPVRTAPYADTSPRDANSARTPTEGAHGEGRPTQGAHAEGTQARGARGSRMPRRRFLLTGLGGVAGAAAVAVPVVMVSMRDSKAKAGPTASPKATRQLYAGVLAGQGAVATYVAFSPDGATLAGGAADGPILLWDTMTGKRLRTLQGHTYPPISIVFSSDGKTLTTGAEIVRIWDLASGREIRSIATQQRTGTDTELFAMAASSDGKYLATDGPNGNALLWDATGGKTLRAFAGNAAAALAFTPNGRALAGGGRNLRLWDVATGTVIRTFAPTTGTIRSIVISRDGRFLASSGQSTPVQLWDMTNGAKIRDFTGMGNTSGPIAFSPDGKLLASAPAGDTAGAEEITLWDVTAGEVNRTLKGHTGDVNALAFHPSGTVLASASQDRTVRLWKLT